MVVQIICNVIIFANCALSILYQVFGFKYVANRAAKRKPYEELAVREKLWQDHEQGRHDAFIMDIVQVMLAGTFFIVVSALACVFDGLSEENFIVIPIMIPLVAAILLGLLYSYIICEIAIKNKIVIFDDRASRLNKGSYKYYSKFVTGFYGAKGGSTLIMGMLMGALSAVPLGQTIYVIVMLVT